MKETVIIPEGIRKLDNDSIEEFDYQDAECIVLPSTLERIDSDAFEECEDIEEIDFSKVHKLKVISSYLLASLKSLKEVVIPEGVERIESEAFNDCTNLERVELPSTLEEIDSSAFMDCESLEEIDFSKVHKLKVIPSDLFASLKSLKEIVIPEGVEMIESDVFNDCTHIERVEFPLTLEKVDACFEGCKRLEEIDMSKVSRLKELPDYFLDGSKATTFVIPQNVKKVGSPLANDCPLDELYIPESVTEIGYITEEANNETDVYLYSGKLKDVEGLCSDTRTLYVLPQHYDRYLRLIEEIDDDSRPEIREMPSYKVNFYSRIDQTESNSQTDNDKTAFEEKNTEQESSAAFISKALDDLINAAVADGELTEKKREIVLRRAKKEGTDLDEVEMLLDARLYEQKNK